MNFGRWACVGLLLAALAASSVAAQQNEAELELDVAGRQLLREAEPYDDKKVACHISKGKRVCVATCYKHACRKVGSKRVCHENKVSCKKATPKKTVKKVEDHPHPEDNHHGGKDDAPGHHRRQLLREAEPYDDKKVACHISKGKKICVTTCYKHACRKVGSKRVCHENKVSCKKVTPKKATAKRATIKKVEDHPHPEDNHHGGKDDAPGHHRRQLLREAEPYDDKKVFCVKSKGKKVCRAECRKKVCYRSKSKKVSCSMKKCDCRNGRLIDDHPHHVATQPRAVGKTPPAYKTTAPFYDDHGGKGKGKDDGAGHH